MAVVESMLMNSLANAFCRMLFHALWQGILLGICMIIIKTTAGKWNTVIRYRIACSMLLCFLLLCIFTFIREWINTPVGDTASNINFPARSIPLMAGNWFLTHQPVVLTVWLCFFCAKMIQLATALIYNRQLMRRQLRQPGEQWLKVVDRLGKLVQVKKTVALFESGYMKIPVVIGHLKPVILVPVGLLNSLTIEQAEAVLLHELAHIRRNDWLINFLQCVTESIFFFHPAVWMVSAWIREEREYCCDEMAIQQTNNKEGLIEALIHFRQQSLNGNTLTMGFPGKKNQLLKRVQYIIQPGEWRINFPGKLLLLFSYAFLLIGGTGFIVLNKTTGTKKPVIVSHPALPTINEQNKPAEKLIPLAAGTSYTKKTARIQLRSVAPAIPAENAEAFTTDKELAEADAEEASHFLQAKLDQAKAMEDQRLSMLDQQRAAKEQEQAERDQEQSAKDQQQAKFDEAKAMQDQQQALMNKKEAERKRLQHQPAS